MSVHRIASVVALCAILGLGVSLGTVLAQAPAAGPPATEAEQAPRPESETSPVAAPPAILGTPAPAPQAAATVAAPADEAKVFGPAIAVGIVVLLIILAMYHLVRRKPTTEGVALPFFASFFMDVIFRPLLPIARNVIVSFGGATRVAWTQKTRLLLDGAGLYTVSAEDTMGCQVLSAVFLCIIFFLVTGNILIGLALAIIGFLYPTTLLQRLIEERKQLMFADLPYVLDLLSLGIEAGLDFKSSIDRLVNFSEPSPIINELRGFLNELNLGTPMEEALVRMRQRIDILAFFTFIEALIQATQMGIDVSSTLRAQAEQMRVSYFQAVEKKANAIPIMILFPSVFFIFPPLIFVTLGPIILELRRRLGD